MASHPANLPEQMAQTKVIASVPPETPAEAPPVSALMEQAESAFVRDFPDLLENHAHQWVAYHGNQRIGIAGTKTELYEACLRLNLRPGEFVVWNIQPVFDENFAQDMLSMWTPAFPAAVP